MAFVLTVIASGADGVLPVRLGSFYKEKSGHGGLAGNKNLPCPVGMFC
jgi:hypothetical protein